MKKNEITFPTTQYFNGLNPSVEAIAKRILFFHRLFQFSTTNFNYTLLDDICSRVSNVCPTCVEESRANVRVSHGFGTDSMEKPISYSMWRVRARIVTGKRWEKVIFRDELFSINRKPFLCTLLLNSPGMQFEPKQLASLLCITRYLFSRTIPNNNIPSRPFFSPCISRVYTHTYIHLSYEENPRGTCSLGLLASSIRFVLNREGGGGGVRFCRGCITDRWGRWRKSEAERWTIHRKEEKRVTGIATNHSSRFLLAFFFLSPLLSLSWRSGKTKKDRAKEREREEIEDNSLEFHRDQHFSIRRIIHFFSPPSIGRSPSLFPPFLPIAVGYFFFPSCAASRTLWRVGGLLFEVLIKRWKFFSCFIANLESLTPLSRLIGR